MRYAALLRAINVGGHVVKMDALRAIFTGAGFAAVQTVIASGNVLFDPDPHGTARAAALESRIETALEAALGYRVATFLRTMPQIAAIAKQRPFGDAEPADRSVYVGFLKAPPTAAGRRALMALAGGPNAFVLDGRELYWDLRGRFSDSGMSGAVIEKALGMETTLRNMTTVRKLALRGLRQDSRGV